MKKLLTILMLALANYASACSCATPTLLENINRSDFIATAKILKITQDSINREFHDIEVELINVYKGSKTTKLKIWSTQMSSCEFFTPVGTTWLIFASFNKDKVLSFHYCDGSMQIDRKFDLATYPNLDKKHKNTVQLKLDVLKFFKKEKLILDDKTQLIFFLSRGCLKNLKGFKGDKKDFTVYEYTINEDRSVSNINSIRNFKNKKLAKEFLACSRSNLKNTVTSKMPIPKKVKQYLIYYYYPEEKGNQSFVGTLDL